MKYEIRLSAPNGDIVPLGAVASEKAVARATAGHTPFHEPTYKGSFQGFAAALLQEAKSGRLKVCDQWGSQSTADELIARAEADGTLVQSSRFIKEPDWDRLHRENEPVVPGAAVWDLTHLDLGPTVTDWAATYISALCTTLKWLNDWGATVGDEFALNHHGVEWFDERGILVGRSAPYGEHGVLLTEKRNMGLLDAPPSDAPVVAVAGAAVLAAEDAPPLEHWKMRLQAEAAAEWLRVRKAGANPTRASIRPHLLKWCKANEVKTAGNINPSDGYLRTHVLSGKHWTPPAD